MRKAETLLGRVLPTGLYRIPYIGTIAIRIICSLEGGQVWSGTLRRALQRDWGITLGNYSYGACAWPGRLPKGTTIGNYCSLADDIVVLRRNHPSDRISQHPFFFNSDLNLLATDSILSVEENPLQIGHDVWIGHGAIITAGCTSIGHSAIVAAGAIVTRNVPPFSIVAGVPARVVKQRVSPQVAKLLTESRWWDHKLECLVPHLHFFTNPISDESAVEFCRAFRANAASETSKA